MSDDASDKGSLHEKFVIGKSYTREDIARITDNMKIRYGISGIHYVGRTTILIVTLDKTGMEYDYEDEFIAPGYFNWDSQNNQAQTQSAIRDIIDGNVEVILFCRLSVKVDKKTRPYIYCGRLVRSGHSSDHPVKFTFKSLDYVYDAQGDLAELYAWRLRGQGQEEP